MPAEAFIRGKSPPKPSGACPRAPAPAHPSGLLPFPFRTFSTSSPRKKPAEAGFFVIASLLARVLDIRLYKGVTLKGK